MCVCCGEFHGTHTTLAILSTTPHTHTHALTQRQQQQCARSLCGRSQTTFACHAVLFVCVCVRVRCKRQCHTQFLSPSASECESQLDTRVSCILSLTHTHRTRSCDEAANALPVTVILRQNSPVPLLLLLYHQQLCCCFTSTVFWREISRLEFEVQFEIHYMFWSSKLQVPTVSSVPQLFSSKLSTILPPASL